MKRSAAFRFTSDICFYYAILSIFPSLVPLHRPMALFAAASLAVSLAAVYVPWAPLRFVLALLPGLAFLTAKPGFSLVFPALAWLYLILVLTPGRFSIWLEGYRRSFRIMLAICLFSMLSSILLGMIKPGITLILPGMVYAMAFFCLSVIAMRRMQMNAEMSLGWNLANLGATVGVPLLAVGCSLLLWRLLLLLKPLGLRLIPLFRRFIAWLINAIDSLLGGDPDAPMPTDTPQPTLTPQEEAIVEPVWAEPTPDIDIDWQLDPESLQKAGRIGVWLLLILLALGLLFLILLRARRNRAKAAQDEFFYEEAKEGRLIRRRKKDARISAPANARQVRLYYRQYMQLMRKRGVKIRINNTSREILTEAELLSASPAAVRLRELYLRARYDDGAAVSLGDVEEAAFCLRQISEDRNWKTETVDARPPDS
ncbi:MAG: DUF4129 domain-containing protein [Clostridia bacterium]